MKLTSRTTGLHCALDGIDHARPPCGLSLPLGFVTPPSDLMLLLFGTRDRFVGVPDRDRQLLLLELDLRLTFFLVCTVARPLATYVEFCHAPGLGKSPLVWLLGVEGVYWWEDL